MSEDETPGGPDRDEEHDAPDLAGDRGSDEPTGDGPAGDGEPRDPAGDGPGGSSTAQPSDRDEELDRLYERLADLEDEVRGRRASKQSLAELRAELDEFEEDVESRTVDKDEVESDLKRYVRRKLRRGHARGWGPYLVLLYGTIMTLGLFYAPNLQSDGWIVFAMFVVWLSTLGLYTLFILVGTVFTVLGIPGRARSAISDWRS
ncbi:hypothetical protein [Haloarchaeobius sp. TZWWS8]|uniref:hypothetical protein n=1 Tax=Haloarchaeobius sp. TZWWS8 TaxID=3446121 RepID=UPI003EBBF75A